jgi:SAM-dependent methyltransferase
MIFGGGGYVLSEMRRNEECQVWKIGRAMQKKKVLFSLSVLVCCLWTIYCVIRCESFNKERSIFSLKSDKERFQKIYETKFWDDKNPSGVGSNRENALPYLKYLQSFIDNHSVKTIVDLGCGNWELMKHIIIPDDVQYLGVDLVDEVIGDNIHKYARGNVQFEVVNNIYDCKKYTGDLLIVKDVMQHWSLEVINYFIKEILVHFRYAILINDFCENAENEQIEVGMHRELDLEKKPFLIKKLTVIKDYISFGAWKRIYLYSNPNKN